MPPLHVAVQNNQMAFVEWLLDEMRVDILSTENSSLYTALHIAVKTENMDMAVALLRRGADPLRQSRRDGENPLELAESSGNNRFLLRFKGKQKKKNEKKKRKEKS